MLILSFRDSSGSTSPAPARLPGVYLLFCAIASFALLTFTATVGAPFFSRSFSDALHSQSVHTWATASLPKRFTESWNLSYTRSQSTHSARVTLSNNQHATAQESNLQWQRQAPTRVPPTTSDSVDPGSSTPPAASAADFLPKSDNADARITMNFTATIPTPPRRQATSAIDAAKVPDAVTEDWAIPQTEAPKVLNAAEDGLPSRLPKLPPAATVSHVAGGNRDLGGQNGVKLANPDVKTLVLPSLDASRAEDLTLSHPKRVATTPTPKRNGLPIASSFKASVAPKPAAPGSAGKQTRLVGSKKRLTAPPPQGAVPSELIGVTWPISTVPQQVGYTCEQPYSRDVHIHVIIPMRSRGEFTSLRHLGMIGLMGADVFAYVREDPGDSDAAQVELPCGMTFHERLLLPNLGEEGAVFTSHVAFFHDNLPDAVILLHGGPLHSWHSLCSVAIRRMRAFYRGLGSGPEASPSMRAFAENAVTLNACNLRAWIVNDCCGPLTCRTHGHTDFPECPWERVGDADASLHDSATALCQLRDRSPETNWTVHSLDVPDFFIRPRAILSSYENDPQQRVPITHARGSALPDMRRWLQTDAFTPPPGEYVRHVPSDSSSRRTLLRGLSGDSNPGGGKSASDGQTSGGNRSGAPPEEALANLRDMLFPQHQEKNLHPQKIVWANHPVYGLDRFWNWVLKNHGLWDTFKQRAELGEAEARWCCLQFAVPRHILQRPPKAWWEDVAFLLTHLGWQDREKWPVALGFLAEWNLWPSMGQKYITKEMYQTYLDIDFEMGPDGHLGNCAAQLSKPLPD